MVRAVDKANAMVADAFQRSKISEAIYHFIQWIHSGCCILKMLPFDKCIFWFYQNTTINSTQNRSWRFDVFVWQICDFGLAKWKAYSQTYTASRSRRGGTVTHTPPEIWQDINNPRTVKYDVYCFAVLLWELITEEQPYEQGVMFTLLSSVTLILVYGLYMSVYVQTGLLKKSLGDFDDIWQFQE